MPNVDLYTFSTVVLPGCASVDTATAVDFVVLDVKPVVLPKVPDALNSVETSCEIS